MQSASFSQHDMLDRRRGVVIPFPAPKPVPVPDGRLMPYQAARWLAGLIVGAWVLIASSIYVLVLR